jgi:hypothetical protein
MIEIAYYDHGKIWHSSVRPTGVRTGIEIQQTSRSKMRDKKMYFQERGDDTLPIFGVIDSNVIKLYFKSVEVCKIDGTTPNPKADISHLDISSSMGLTIGVGIEEEYTDVFFMIKDKEALLSIAKYYKLPFPLAEDSTFDTDPDWYRHNNIVTTSKELFDKHSGHKLGAIKFRGTTPIILKAYYTCNKK